MEVGPGAFLEDGVPGHGFGTMADGIFPSMRVEKFLSVAEDSLSRCYRPSALAGSLLTWPPC